MYYSNFILCVISYDEYFSKCVTYVISFDFDDSKIINSIFQMRKIMEQGGEAVIKLGLGSIDFLTQYSIHFTYCLPSVLIF